MQPKNLQSLQDAIAAMYGANAWHVKSVPVHEMFCGVTTWKGFVEVFALTGHPKAKRAYAWQYRDDDETKTVAVLEIPPVDSAEGAVKAAIVAKAREGF